MTRQSLQSGLQQISPLALVTHAANNQQAQAAAAAVAAHHRLMAPSFGQVQNVMEYLKMMQVKAEQNEMSNGSGTMRLSPQRQHPQQHRQRSESPEISPKDALNALEMSRAAALWQMYNDISPPASVSSLPLDGATINSGKSLDCVTDRQR